jgi:hypothetical protein
VDYGLKGFSQDYPFELETIMKAIIVEALGGLDRVKRIELPDPAPPGAGAIKVRLHACSGFCLGSPR